MEVAKACSKGGVCSDRCKEKRLQKLELDDQKMAWGSGLEGQEWENPHSRFLGIE